MSDTETTVVEPKKGRGRPPKSKQAKKEDKAIGDKDESPVKRGRPMRKAAEEANRKSIEKKEDEDDEPKVKRSRGRPAGSTKSKKGKPASKGGKRGRPPKSAVNNSAKENETNEDSPEDEEDEEEEPVSSGEDKTD